MAGPFGRHVYTRAILRPSQSYAGARCRTVSSVAGEARTLHWQLCSTALSRRETCRPEAGGVSYQHGCGTYPRPGSVAHSAPIASGRCAVLCRDKWPRLQAGGGHMQCITWHKRSELSAHVRTKGGGGTGTRRRVTGLVPPIKHDQLLCIMRVRSAKNH